MFIFLQIVDVRSWKYWEAMKVSTLYLMRDDLFETIDYFGHFYWFIISVIELLGGTAAAAPPPSGLATLSSVGAVP